MAKKKPLLQFEVMLVGVLFKTTFLHYEEKFRKILLFPQL